LLDQMCQIGAWKRHKGVCCAPAANAPKEMGRLVRPLVSKFQNLAEVSRWDLSSPVDCPDRDPDGRTTGGISFWAKEPLAEAPAPEMRLSAEWIFQPVPGGECFVNLIFGDFARILSEKLHYSHESEWTPVAGAHKCYELSREIEPPRPENNLSLGSLSEQFIMAVLIRLPRSNFPALQLVCRSWHEKIRGQDFLDARRHCPLTGQSCLQPLVLIVGGQYDGDGPEELLRIGQAGVDKCKRMALKRGHATVAGSTMHHGRASMLVDGTHYTQVARAPLPFGNGHILVALKEEIYVLGAAHHLFTDSTAMSFPFTPVPQTSMAWSPQTNRWRVLPRMISSRAMAAACGAADGRLYVFGGQNGDDIASCEYYDPAANIWTSLPPLPFPCHSARAVAIGRKLYLFGGNFMPMPATHDRIQVGLRFCVRLLS
jgi:hypothetical protein